MEPLVRPSASAGQFYPEKKEELLFLLKSLESEALKWKPKISGNVSGLIVPHAGYLFSGKTAMTGYLSLKNSRSDSFILIGPKHSSRPAYTSVYPRGQWETPLGLIEVNERISRYFTESSPGFLADLGAHTGEHSLEVEVPFLQYVIGGDFSIIPILMGNQQKKEALKVAKLLYESDLNIPLVISTDLNHYERLSTTLRKDSLMIDSIISLDVNRFYRVLEKDKISACGYGPVAVLMEYTRLKGGWIELIDHSTSYHYSKDMEKVVGYASLASIT